MTVFPETMTGAVVARAASELRGMIESFSLNSDDPHALALTAVDLETTLEECREHVQDMKVKARQLYP